MATRSEQGDWVSGGLGDRQGQIARSLDFIGISLGEAVIGLMNVESKFQKQTENITIGVTRGFLPGGSWVRD